MQSAAIVCFCREVQFSPASVNLLQASRCGRLSRFVLDLESLLVAETGGFTFNLYEWKKTAREKCGWQCPWSRLHSAYLDCVQVSCRWHSFRLGSFGLCNPWVSSKQGGQERGGEVKRFGIKPAS
jgi:hypothetical protein